MNAGDNPLIGGLVSASTLIGCHGGLAHRTLRFRWPKRWTDGRAQVLVQDGRVDTALMQRKLLCPATWKRPCVQAAACMPTGWNAPPSGPTETPPGC